MNTEEMEFTPRIYTVTGEFNDKMAEDFITWVLQIENDDILFHECYPEEPLPCIQINIMSQGGSCGALNAMLDALDLLDCTIITRCLGYAYSCALYLFVRGDIRLAGNNTDFLYHECLYGIDGSLSDHRTMLKNSKVLQNKYDEFLCERTNMTKSFLNSKHGKDYLFDKKTALELGVVTHDCKVSDLCYLENLEGNDEVERRIED